MKTADLFQSFYSDQITDRLGCNFTLLHLVSRKGHQPMKSGKSKVKESLATYTKYTNKRLKFIKEYYWSWSLIKTKTIMCLTLSRLPTQWFQKQYDIQKWHTIQAHVLCKGLSKCNLVSFLQEQPHCECIFHYISWNTQASVYTQKQNIYSNQANSPFTAKKTVQQNRNMHCSRSRSRGRVLQSSIFKVSPPKTRKTKLPERVFFGT